MTKYLMILAALMLMVACGGDDGNEQPDADTTPVWTTYAGLEWSPRSEYVMHWQSAIDYCEAMGARLPNINELRKIIINCPGSAYGGTCKVSDPDCLSSDCRNLEDCRCDGSAASYSALGDGKKNIWLWSSSSHASPTYNAWLVGFDYGGVNGYNKDGSFHARCVR